MNFLVDIIPPKARRYVYGGLSLAALVYAAWEAAHHNWQVMLASLIGSGVTALAHANVAPEDADVNDG